MRGEEFPLLRSVFCGEDTFPDRFVTTCISFLCIFKKKLFLFFVFRMPACDPILLHAGILALMCVRASIRLVWFSGTGLLAGALPEEFLIFNFLKGLCTHSVLFSF